MKTETVKKCPSCDEEMNQNTFICIGCGLDERTGKRIPMDILMSRGELSVRFPNIVSN